MVQANVTSVLDWLDEWSDGNIHVLADRMRYASRDQVVEMVEQWPIFTYELPRVEPGELRPLISLRRGEGHVLPAALRLLLYSEHVVIDSQLLHPHRAQGDWPNRSQHRWYLAADLPEYLHTIANLRPLIEDGSLMFTDRRDQRAGFERDNLDSYFSATERIDEHLWDYNEFPAVRGLSGSTVLTPHLAPDLFTIIDGRATAVALSHNERLIFEAVLSSSSLDSRLAELSKLARLTVPDYQMNTQELVALRRRSQPLREFRSALRLALREVAATPETPAMVKAAQAIVADVLGTELEAVNQEARQSPLLSTLRSASRRLGLTGIGAATGAATLGSMGMPLAGALAGAATGTAINVTDSAREYSQAIRHRQDSRAVSQVLMSFRSVPEQSSSR